MTPLISKNQVSSAHWKFLLSRQPSWQAHHQSSREVKASRYSFWTICNLLFAHLHPHTPHILYVRWTCINFFSQRCYSCFWTMLPHHGKMMTSSKLHQMHAANMNQRSDDLEVFLSIFSRLWLPFLWGHLEVFDWTQEEQMSLPVNSSLSHSNFGSFLLSR